MIFWLAFWICAEVSLLQRRNLLTRENSDGVCRRDADGRSFPAEDDFCCNEHFTLAPRSTNNVKTIYWMLLQLLQKAWTPPEKGMCACIWGLCKNFKCGIEFEGCRGDLIRVSVTFLSQRCGPRFCSRPPDHRGHQWQRREPGLWLPSAKRVWPKWAVNGRGVARD